MFLLMVQGIGVVTVSIQSQPEIQNVCLEPTRKQQCPCRCHPTVPFARAPWQPPWGSPLPLVQTRACLSTGWFLPRAPTKLQQSLCCGETARGNAATGVGGRIIVKPWVKYLGVLLGNVSGQEAYGPVIPKTMSRAKTLSTLPLGTEEKAHFFTTWVAPVLYLMARAHEPTDKVLSQLNLIQRVALGLNSWHLMAGILSMPKKQGGLAHAPLASYALWVHSHSFVTAVCHPHVYDASHMEQFQSWAGRVGMVLDEATLPYIQLAPVNIRKPSFLQGALRAYSRVRRGGSEVPPPPPQLLPQMGIWHSVFFGAGGDTGLTSVCPRLVRKCVLRWRDLVVAGVVHLAHL